MIPIITAIMIDILKQDEDKELCKELKKNMKKFSQNNNIYRSLLYDYHLFCKDNF